MSKTIPMNLSELAKHIRSITRPVDGYPDPELLEDLWNELEGRIKEMESEIEASRKFERSINEALNSGDGAYSP